MIHLQRLVPGRTDHHPQCNEYPVILAPRVAGRRARQKLRPFIRRFISVGESGVAFFGNSSALRTFSRQVGHTVGGGE